MASAAAKGKRAERTAAGGSPDLPGAAGRGRGSDRKFVTALGRGLEVLRAFGAGDRQLGNQEIAQRTGLPKPTVSRLSYTLTRLGYLRQLPSDGKYALGSAVLGLGLSALGQMDVRRIARPLMQALAEHTHGSVNLGIRDQLGMIYIDTYRQAASYTVQLDVGSRVPLATTSMGRAWLAAAPERQRRAVLEEVRATAPAGFAELRRAIEQALREYEARGFCMSIGAWRREVNAVAAPLAAADGGEILVFSCSGAPFQFNREKLEAEIGPRLVTLVGNVRSALAAR
jgi:DNA-binding IclR family transcriptional regulator